MVIYSEEQVKVHSDIEGKVHNVFQTLDSRQHMPEKSSEDAVQGRETQIELRSENVENSGKPRQLEFVGQSTGKETATKRGGAPKTCRRVP